MFALTLLRRFYCLGGVERLHVCRKLGGVSCKRMMTRYNLRVCTRVIRKCAQKYPVIKTVSGAILGGFDSYMLLCSLRSKIRALRGF